MCQLPNKVPGQSQAPWPQSLYFALQRTSPTLFPSWSPQGLAKLDKQLPRAASCLVIVYYGSDWDLGTDTSQLPSGCKKLQQGVDEGHGYNKAGWNDPVENFRQLLFQICFNKGGRGHGWDITVHSWSLSLLLNCQRWGSFSRFDLYPMHNLERPGTERRFQSSSKYDDSAADKCSDWNHMWPWALPSLGLLRAGSQGRDPSVEIRMPIVWVLWEVGHVGSVSPSTSYQLSYVTLGGASYHPYSFAFSSHFGACLSCLPLRIHSLIPGPRVTWPYCPFRNGPHCEKMFWYWKLENNQTQIPNLPFISALGMWPNLTEPQLLI